jgi:hypothetical protein
MGQKLEPAHKQISCIFEYPAYDGFINVNEYEKEAPNSKETTV